MKEPVEKDPWYERLGEHIVGIIVTVFVILVILGFFFPGALKWFLNFFPSS